MSALLQIDKIECRYDNHAVVNGLSFELEAGSVACLLGPSGCGKTTVLRAIAGFEPVTGGQILLDGEIISRQGYTRPPERRGLGMVFQDYALFPHLTVAENICFGLKNQTRKDKISTADRMLKLVGLQGLNSRYPHELSGGQQQRIALARALAPHPALILMDEPFSNLDGDLRERLSREVREILKEAGTSGILVTHDQHEAFAMGDCVGVMHEGRVLQCDPPYRLYHQPENRFVANFIGQGAFLNGEVLGSGVIQTTVGELSCGRSPCWPAGTLVDVLMRPDDVMPARSKDDDESCLQVCVVDKAFKGAEILYTLAVPSGEEILSLFPSHLNYEPGDNVRVKIDAEHVIAFER